jgi:hypothetical protein
VRETAVRLAELAPPVQDDAMAMGDLDSGGGVYR